MKAVQLRVLKLSTGFLDIDPGMSREYVSRRVAPVEALLDGDAETENIPLSDDDRTHVETMHFADAVDWLANMYPEQKSLQHLKLAIDGARRSIAETKKRFGLPE